MKRLLALLAASAPALAPAHEILHDVERGRAVAVKAYEADGEVLAGARYQVFSPRDPRTPYQEGRTDRNGWLAFVPDAPGAWRVKVVEEGGHGLDLEVDPGSATAPAGGARSTAAFVLRPLAGLAAIAAIFAALFALQRRRRPAP